MCVTKCMHHIKKLDLSLNQFHNIYFFFRHLIFCQVSFFIGIQMG